MNQNIAYFYGEALAAGTFLGMAFLHMIPVYLRSEPYIKDFGYDLNSILFIIVLFIFFLFDLIARKHKRNENESSSYQKIDADTPLQMRSILVPYLEENGL